MKYTNERLKEISFPLGGIGSGSIGLSGNGRLIDWEIFNRPNKGSCNGFSHIAVKAVKNDGSVIARVLNSDLQKDLNGQFSQTYYSGFGYGPANTTMAGFPHFRNCEFDGQFPIARLRFWDESFPGVVVLTAFNPFIPLDSKNSSIPAAFFDIEIENNTNEDIIYTIAFSLMNPFEISKNEIIDCQMFSIINLKHSGVATTEKEYGDLTLLCNDANAIKQKYWYRGGWQDGIATFWREFATGRTLSARDYPNAGEKDMCTIASNRGLVATGKNTEARFILSWNIPNNYNYWQPMKDVDGKDVTWMNYYATIFENSIESAKYSMQNWASLYAKTFKFKETLFSCTLGATLGDTLGDTTDDTADDILLDAISSTLSVLKSPTVLRLEDGSFYGWEGVHEKAGSCEGTCSHVWNYAYALCFLFPDLERSIRDLEFKYNTDENGEMRFRLKLPLGRTEPRFRACVDGQMGSVIKAFREWKLSGDDKWLRDNWSTIQRIIEYAWSDANPDKWDTNRDGVLEGRQHHTLDMELFGPSAWLEGFYLAALKAGAQMAQHLGLEEKSREYMELYEKGYAWTKENLFNGEYFVQNIDLTNKSILKEFQCEHEYWNDESGEIKYQIGEGCDIDQLCGQWHADICGLGSVFDKQQVKTALTNLYKNNYKPSIRTVANPWRLFSLNDDSGTLICDYPEGVRKPAIPVPYCEETMHGFEYQLAGLMFKNGMMKQGMDIVRAVRKKYDGEKRNPWNEIECGSNYARSMASFAFMIILSGFEFDLPNKSLGFNPIASPNKTTQKFLWSVGTGWGYIAVKQKEAEIKLLSGNIELEKLNLGFANDVISVEVDAHKVDFQFDFSEHRITFDKVIVRDVIKVIFK